MSTNKKRKIEEKERKSQLINSLSLYGLKLRKDSKLCQSFVKGKENIDFVVSVMRNMEIIFNRLNFSHLDINYNASSNQHHIEIWNQWEKHCDLNPSLDKWNPMEIHLILFILKIG